MRSRHLERIDTISVKVPYLNRLLEITGEIVINQSRLNMLSLGLKNKLDMHGIEEKELIELSKQVSMIGSGTSIQLEEIVTSMRMVEISQIFDRYSRLIRDSAKKIHSKVKLIVSGRETTVDKIVIEQINEPLVHILRNAVAHGAENPEIRKKIGKPEEAVIRLTASKDKKYTKIIIEDDGKGLDTEMIKKIAQEKKLITREEAEALKNEDVFKLIFLPGFSTSTEVSDISGRGVGMDVVKDTILKLNGELLVESEQGHWTRFTIKLPTLAVVNIADALIVKEGDELYAIPLEYIASIIKINRNNLPTVSGKPAIVFQDLTIIVYYLGSIVGAWICSEQQKKKLNVIVLRCKTGTIGVVVDELRDIQKIVINSFSTAFESVKGVMGTTVLGTEKIGLILDVPGLLSLVQGTDQSSGIVEEKVFNEAAETSPGRKLEIDEMLRDFIVELDKNIKMMNNDIMVFEENPDNADVINAVFRSVHSVKSCSGMMDFDSLTDFMHEVEKLLENIRLGTVSNNAEIIDILLDSLSVMEKYSEMLKKGIYPDVDTADIIDMISKYTKLEDMPERLRDVSNIDFEITPFETLVVEKFKKNKKNIYELLVELGELRMNFARAFLIFKKLLEVSDIISTIPDIRAINEGNFKNNFKILLATGMEEDELRKFARVDLGGVTDIKKFNISVF